MFLNFIKAKAKKDYSSAINTNLFDEDKKEIQSSDTNDTNDTNTYSKKEITDKLTKIISGTKDMANNTNELSGSITDISSIVEELSANTEETASATQEISNNVKAVDAVATDVAVNLVQSMSTVSEISMRASQMKEDSVNAHANAVNMVSEFDKMLNEAVQKAEVVTEINDLSESVLSIASQINLISLNASIEAARAGEHGRGFSVVAAEIKKLADQTKNTVMNIQKIAAGMNKFLSDLIESSNMISQFMKGQVIGDYDKFVSISEQYNLDAEGINTMFENYAVTVDNLSTTMASINEQVEAIAIATEEDAKGANEIVENLVNITEKSEKVSSIIDATSKQLLSLYSLFDE
jgi:methyl-accepting chemotaxis protein